MTGTDSWCLSFESLKILLPLDRLLKGYNFMHHVSEQTNKKKECDVEHSQ